MDKYEKIVYDYFNSKGKKSICIRFQDTLDASKRVDGYRYNPAKLVVMDKNPSDFIITDNGETYYAEVKHTQNTSHISSSLLRQQKMYRERILACGGKYMYYIYAEDIHQWYAIPGEFFVDKGDVKWKEVGKYMINYLRSLR
jgi:hypothetical protein